MYSWEQVKECRGHQCRSMMTVASVPCGGGPHGHIEGFTKKECLCFSTLTNRAYQCGIRAGTRDGHKERFPFYGNNKV